MADESDDAISLTSTIDRQPLEQEGDEDADGEFTVKAIIGERDTFGGIRKWLVLWDDPYTLRDATWEPEENLANSLDELSQWNVLKSKIQQGQEKSLVPQWVKEKQDMEWAGWRRHMKRNEARKKLGLAETTRFPTPQEINPWIADEWLSDKDSELREEPSDGELDFTRLNNPASAKKGKKDQKTEASKSSSPRPKQPELSQSVDKADKKNATSGGTRPTDVSAKSPFPSKPNVLKVPPPFPWKYGSNPEKKVPEKTGVEKKGFESKEPEKPRPTAKKSKPTPTTSNVFVGGTKPKEKKTKDKTGQGEGPRGKVPSLKYQNIWTKHSRNRENEAPPTIPKSLRSLNPKEPIPKTGPNASNASAEPANRPTQGSSPARTAPSNGGAPVPSEDKPASPRPGISRRSSMKPVRITERPTTEVPKSELPLKKKKSVRFQGAFTADNESNEDSLFVQGDAVSHGPRLKSPPPTNMDEDPRPAPLRNMSKPCSIGAEASSTVILHFHNVSQPQAPWAEALKSQKQLMFSHTCHANDFITQFVGQCRQMASGSVSAPADSETIETVTDRLKIGSLGVFCYTESYCMILYPSKSDDWAEADQLRVVGNEGPLRYIILEPAPFTQSELPNAKPNNHSESLVGANLNSFLGLDAGKKIPLSPNCKKGEKHHVFLAFPPGAVEQTRLMTQWITVACKVECIVLDSNNTAGDWNRFVDHGRGALIIHEDAFRKMRQFPRMFEVLKRSSQGHIAVCILDRALASSVSATMWARQKPRIGNIGLRKLASTGSVFMLTPSFIVSSPTTCRRFLRWFWDHYTSKKMTLRVKLAVPAGILDWMEDLVINQTERRECSTGDRDKWEASIDILRNLMSLTGDDEEDDGSDILTPLALAPPKIDASDEQSLVNWFGWWTASVLDSFCCFYVIGGGPFAEATGPSIYLKPVTWEKGIVNDPDHALALLRGNLDERPTQEHALGVPKPLRLVPSDSSSNLRTFLEGKYAEVKKNRESMFLYFKPVAHENTEMAYDLGDMGYQFSTYAKWFTSFLNIAQLVKRAGQPTQKHTLTGFFYTPESDEQTPQLENRRTPIPHSWIAMFRPCNPDQALWTQTELFIWDQRYRGRIKGGQDLYESDLLPVHRAFIAFVGHINNKTNPMYTLAKVWVGGWDDWISPYGHPLDITLDRLDLFTDNLKRWVPFWEQDITVRGWTMIKADSERPDPMLIDSNPVKPPATAEPIAPEVEEKEDDDDDWDPDARMIFHPPRPHSTRLSSSIVANRFYREFHKMRAPDRDGRLAYKYVPTKLWYGQQVKQGRAFGHVMVDAWEVVFEDLRISTG